LTGVLDIVRDGRGSADPCFWGPRFLLCLRLLAIVDAYVRSTLECGGSTPPLSEPSALFQGGVEPPHSKVLRTTIFLDTR